ncbi:hypothetical protein HNY73_011827 [Argiope bruennichi]|uniref:Uncharacterized protein n=1 Tax=Argiope bruennichi TaxID=94029 RepID=A0A8T0ET79_ARGBR|nr:hypothetical protein HNY73_011827 [Argiope bruennichi]
MAKYIQMKKDAPYYAPLTRADTIVHRIACDYDPGESLRENKDIQRQILIGLKMQPRRILTREIFHALLKNCEVQELNECDDGISKQISNITLSDISSQTSESADVTNLNNNSISDLRSLENLPIRDVSCASIFNPEQPVQNQLLDYQEQDNQVTDHSKTSHLNRWIENALDFLLPYVP